MKNLLELTEKPDYISDTLYNALVIVSGYSTSQEKQEHQDELVIEAMLLAAALDADNGDFERASKSLSTDRYLTVNLADKQSLPDYYDLFKTLRSDNVEEYKALKFDANRKLRNYIEAIRVSRRLNRISTQKDDLVTNLIGEERKHSTLLEPEEVHSVDFKDLIDNGKTEVKKAEKSALSDNQEYNCPRCGKPLVFTTGIYVGYEHPAEQNNPCRYRYRNPKEIEKYRKKFEAKAALNADEVGEEPPVLILGRDEALDVKSEQEPETREEKRGIFSPLTKEKRIRLVKRAETKKPSREEENQISEELEDMSSKLNELELADLILDGYSVSSKKSDAKEEEKPAKTSPVREMPEESFPQTELLTPMKPEVEEEPVRPVLISKNTGESYIIDKPSYMIGKVLESQLTLVTNSKVSRRHAVIVTKNGGYYIKDTNSTNGTYINGYRIPPGVEVELKDGMIVTFANEEFQYRYEG